MDPSVAPVFALSGTPSPPASVTATTLTAVSPAGDSEQRLARRRKQCRVSQRRYRDKKGSAEYNLRLDVNSLRASVERLRQTRQLLESRLWSDRMSLVGPIRKAVEQYYVMFSQGLHNPDAGGHALKCFDVQVGFLNAFLDPDVRFGETQGVSGVVEQWRRYSEFHETMWVKTVSAEILGAREAPIAVVQGLLGVRLSRTTIETLFPHILEDEELVQTLIGQEVVYDTCTTYAFNEKNQVLRQDLSVDFLAGLTKLLGGPRTTSHVLGNALISASSKIGETNELKLSVPVFKSEPTAAAAVHVSYSYEPEPEASSPFEELDDDEEEDELSPRGACELLEEKLPQPVSRLDLQFILS
ncbi:hypothetical protein Gpo141_00003567 [Globisporangium polare]